jgi:hypothetical protein
MGFNSQVADEPKRENSLEIKNEKPGGLSS